MPKRRVYRRSLLETPKRRTARVLEADCQSGTDAVNRPKFKENVDSEVDFIDIVPWRNTAEFASKWFRKGQLVAVEGRIQVRSYKDKEQNNRKAFEVVADQVHFAESKKDNGYNTAPSSYGASPASAHGTDTQNTSFGAFHELIEDDGELPF